MAIKFEFTVADVDAENIVSALHDRINKENELILKEMDKGSNLTGEAKRQSDAEIQWYRKSIVYTKGLIKKMKNTHVDDSELV